MVQGLVAVDSASFAWLKPEKGKRNMGAKGVWKV